jgi:hypothetical protein
MSEPRVHPVIPGIAQQKNSLMAFIYLTLRNNCSTREQVDP